MTKEKSLSDLHVRGRKLDVHDAETGDVVTVWLQKLNPNRSEQAYRSASAARARLLLEARDETSDLYLITKQEVHEMTREMLFEYVTSEDVVNRARSLEAELAAEDEWAEEDKLQSLRDAWRDGLSDKFAEDPEDPDAKRVFEEMSRFATKVEEQLKEYVEHLQSTYEQMNIEDLREKALSRVIEMRGEMAWLNEHSRAQVFHATRSLSDHTKPYFARREEVDDLEADTLNQLIAGYRNLEVDIEQGKSLQETPSS